MLEGLVQESPQASSAVRSWLIGLTLGPDETRESLRVGKDASPTTTATIDDRRRSAGSGRWYSRTCLPKRSAVVLSVVHTDEPK